MAISKGLLIYYCYVSILIYLSRGVRSVSKNIVKHHYLEYSVSLKEEGVGEGVETRESSNASLKEVEDDTEKLPLLNNMFTKITVVYFCKACNKTYVFLIKLRK